MELRVEVRSGTNDYADEGTLEAYSEGYLKLRKDNGKFLYITRSSVRLIKPLPLPFS